MPVIDAYGARRKHNVMQDTWGHMYPEPTKKYPCKILLVHHENSTMLLDRVNVCGCSPQEYELVCSILTQYEWTNGIHLVDCVLWFFKNSDDLFISSKPIGKIIKVKITTLHDTDNWELE